MRTESRVRSYFVPMCLSEINGSFFVSHCCRITKYSTPKKKLVKIFFVLLFSTLLTTLAMFTTTAKFKIKVEKNRYSAMKFFIWGINRTNVKNSKDAEFHAITDVGLSAEIQNSFKERRRRIDQFCYHDISPMNSTYGSNRSYRLLLNSRNRMDSLRKNWIFFQAPTRDNRSVTVEWCPVFKAASSPWMALFAKLSKSLTPHTENLIHSGKITFVKLMRDFRMNIPKKGKGTDRRYRMIIVRHPFERLVSAYRDKLERVKGREFYHKKYGYRIASASASPSNGTEPTVHKLIADMLRFHNSPLHSPHLKINYKPPTFKEFIDYLLSIDPRGMDEHWRPIFLDCNPCHYHFDFILKVETMTEDKLNVLRMFGMDLDMKELDDVWNRWTNTASGGTGSTKTANYFAQIGKSELKGLEKLYGMDMMLFGYEAKEYYGMVRADND